MQTKGKLKLPPLIALAGAEGAGKTTAARCLQAAYGYHVRSFAECIKAFLTRLGVPREALFGTQARKAESIAHGRGLSGRQLMISLGDWVASNLGADAIATSLMSEIERDGHLLVVIDDLRFAAEFEAVMAAGGVAWLVARDANTPRAVGTRVILNDGDVPRLFDRIAAALAD